MSSQGQETASPTFSVLDRLSCQVPRSSSSSSITPDTVLDVAAGMDPNPSSSKPAPFKYTPFKRLKSQLEKRRRSSKEKGKAVERTPPQTSRNTATAPTLEAISQSTETASGAASCDSGADYAAGGSQNESGDHDTLITSAEDDSQTISTTTLARRIHSLLSPFPSHYTLTPHGSFLPHRTTDPHGGAADSVDADSTLFSLLSSISAMNGSISKGRESVWAVLERLRYLPHPHPHPKEERRDEDEDEDDTRARDNEAQSDNVDMSSVMICCPLQPTEDTEVEIARSEVVSINFEEEIFHEPAPVEQPKEQGVGMMQWPFGRGRGRAEPVPLAEKDPPPPPKKKEVRVWYPSRTKVSLQAFWWGYRIYLPPPVMRVLSDRSLEAAKRAAMITAALTWLVSHLPTAMLPPQMKAVVGVVKQIVPIMGYVGGFIAWSWNTVQGFDKGQGVTLSATWLLPIALVPGTWFYTEPPTSPSSGEPAGI